LIVEETINVKFNDFSWIDLRLSDLDNEFAYMWISKPKERIVDKGSSVSATRRSHASKEINEINAFDEGSSLL